LDRQQIDSLHEVASDHYLQGEFRQAREVWEQLLGLDPSDEKAREGVRLSSLLAEGEAEPPPSPPSDASPAARGPFRSGDAHRKFDEIEARIEAGDTHGAVRAAETLRGEFGDDPDVLAALARAYLAAGSNEEAAEVCQRALEQDPAYAEAASLLRECRQLDPDGSDLDIDLSVLDSLAVPKSAAGRFGADLAHAHDEGEDDARALRLREGFDVGDVSRVESVPTVEDFSELPEPVAPAELEPVDEPAMEELLVSAPSARADFAPAEDAAAAVLRGRIQDLLVQARTAADEGRRDEAHSIVSRVLILDDENVEALDLQARLHDGAAAHAPEDPAGVGALALEAEPAPGARDLVAASVRPPAAIEHDEPTIDLDTDESPPAVEPEGATEVAAAAPASSRAPFRWRVDRRILLAAAAAAVAGLLWFGGRALLEGPGAAPPAPPAPVAESAPASRPPAPARVQPPAARMQKPPAREPGSSPGEFAERMSHALERARTALAERDYAAAVIAYNEALEISPDNVEAREGLREAGDLYREHRVEADQLERAKRAFELGDYAAALRAFYRLPQGEHPAALERYKVNGWYNLGLTALRAGDCTRAIENFDEALQIRPTDAGLRAIKAFAAKYLAAPRDRDFYEGVEGLAFRTADE